MKFKFSWGLGIGDWGLQSQQPHRRRDAAGNDRRDRRLLRRARHPLRDRRMLPRLHRNSVRPSAFENSPSPDRARRVHQALCHGGPALGLSALRRLLAALPHCRLRPKLGRFIPRPDGGNCSSDVRAGMDCQDPCVYKRGKQICAHSSARPGIKGL